MKYLIVAFLLVCSGVNAMKLDNEILDAKQRAHSMKEVQRVAISGLHTLIVCLKDNTAETRNKVKKYVDYYDLEFH
jgi:hypothetical protein